MAPAANKLAANHMEFDLNQRVIVDRKKTDSFTKIVIERTCNYHRQILQDGKLEIYAERGPLQSKIKLAKKSIRIYALPLHCVQIYDTGIKSFFHDDSSITAEIRQKKNQLIGCVKFRFDKPVSIDAHLSITMHSTWTRFVCS